MRTIWRLFTIDFSSLFKNTVAGIIVLGLVFLPSIFSWYNILACWNVFDNTGNLTVAVANSDKGYESDLVPIKINVGENVESALRANDQLNWVFVDEDEAIDGAMSGKYYAAVVIPPSFSQDMMTFYSNDVEHAKILYYTNEKKSAVAPKVTDQGADRVSYQINATFIETLSEIGLNIAQGVQKYADETNMSGHIGSLSNTVESASDDMDQAARVLRSYSALITSTRDLLTSSAALVNQAQGSVDAIRNNAGQGEQDVANVAQAVQVATSSLNDALAIASSGYDKIDRAIDSARDSSGNLTRESAQIMRDSAASIDAQIATEQAILSQLEQIADVVDPGHVSPIRTAIAQLSSSIDMQQSYRDKLLSAASGVEAGEQNAEGIYQEAKSYSQQAKNALAESSVDFENNIKPQLDELTVQVSAAAGRIDSNAQVLREAADSLAGGADSAAGKLDATKVKLDSCAEKLEQGSMKLKGFSGDLRNALKDNNIAQLKEILGSDSSVLANALASPVVLDRHEVFPADNFGSQMAPLYTVLALWIGSLLLVVAIKVGVSEETRNKLGNPTLSQLFLGRFGIFALLSFMQTTVMGLGNWLFLGVQVDNPLLFMLCFWISGLVFTFIIYSLVVSFANLGKALGVLLLILQVTSAGGSFPLQLLPPVFQVISPYVPATHVINAMRAAMMGVYQNDFWIEMGELMLFVVPMAILGLALRRPLINFLNAYIARVENSKLVN